MVCTKSPIGLRRRTAAFCVARAVARGNLMILVSWVFDQRETRRRTEGGPPQLRWMRFLVGTAGCAVVNGEQTVYIPPHPMVEGTGFPRRCWLRQTRSKGSRT